MVDRVDQLAVVPRNPRRHGLLKVDADGGGAGDVSPDLLCQFRVTEGILAARTKNKTALTCTNAGQGVVEVAGIEPASSGFSIGLLRAQPAVNCRDRFRYRRQVRSVSD